MSDFFEIEALLPDPDRALLDEVRTFMRADVAPIINDYWFREEFPHDVWPHMAQLGIGGLAFDGYGCPGRRPASSCTCTSASLSADDLAPALQAA